MRCEYSEILSTEQLNLNDISILNQSFSQSMLNQYITILVQFQFIIHLFQLLTQFMLKTSNDKKRRIQSQGYDTPVKNYQGKIEEHRTAAQTRFTSNHNLSQNSHAQQRSNTTMNMFNKRRYHRCIKKSNFHLLHLERNRLQDIKQKYLNQGSNSANQKYKQELDIVYVVMGRIQKIQENKKYYIFYCQDQALKGFRLYYIKQLDTQNRHKNNAHSSHKIVNIDQLQFQSKPGQGSPYFKFFVIFRQIPIFEKTQDSVTSSQEQQERPSEDSLRKRLIPKVKGTELRIYIQHLQKVTNFNYISWHNMQTCLQFINWSKTQLVKLQVQQ